MNVRNNSQKKEYKKDSSWNVFKKWYLYVIFLIILLFNIISISKTGIQSVDEAKIGGAILQSFLISLVISVGFYEGYKKGLIQETKELKIWGVFNEYYGAIAFLLGLIILFFSHGRGFGVVSYYLMFLGFLWLIFCLIYKKIKGENKN